MVSCCGIDNQQSSVHNIGHKLYNETLTFVVGPKNGRCVIRHEWIIGVVLETLTHGVNVCGAPNTTQLPSVGERVPCCGSWAARSLVLTCGITIVPREAKRKLGRHECVMVHPIGSVQN